jgi:hypothetical protein
MLSCCHLIQLLYGYHVQQIITAPAFMTCSCSEANLSFHTPRYKIVSEAFLPSDVLPQAFIQVLPANRIHGQNPKPFIVQCCDRHEQRILFTTPLAAILRLGAICSLPIEPSARTYWPKRTVPSRIPSVTFAWITVVFHTFGP